MNKILIAIVGVCLVQSILASPAPAESNSIDVPENSTRNEFDFKPVNNLVAALYRRAMVQALQTKVTELHTKLTTGENAIPTAVDILKLTLLSNPAQETLRKAAEHVLGMMSPELKSMATEAGNNVEEPTTPMAKKQA